MTTTWFTAPEEGEELLRLVNAWPEAPVEKGELLDMLLEVAQEQVIAYAPAPATPAAALTQLLATLGLADHTAAVLTAAGLDPNTPAPLPRRYVLAQLYQAQALWDDGRTDGEGNIGDGAFVFTPRPLDKKIRGIIRPMDGKPHGL